MKSKKKNLKLNKMNIAKIGNISSIKGGAGPGPDSNDTCISVISCDCTSIPTNANDEATTSV